MLGSTFNTFGDTPELTDAVYDSDIQRVRELIAAGADLNVKSGDGGYTALMFSLLYNWEITDALLAAGADVNAESNNGQTALHIANDVPEMVRVLLKAGADPNGGHYEGGPPVFAAAYRGQFESVLLLAEAGADLHTKGLWSPGTPYPYPPILGDVRVFSNILPPEIVRFLVDRGALTAVLNDSDVRVRDRPTTESSNTIGMLQKGDEVTVLGRGESEVVIGGMSDYWLKIRLKNGTTGYSYGAFFDVASLAKHEIPEFFKLEGSRWGPPGPSSGYFLDLNPDRTYRFINAGGGGGARESRGTWDVTNGEVVLDHLDHKEAFREELFPKWARNAGSRWTVQEDPENLYFLYRLTNTYGDSLWSQNFHVKRGTQRRFQERTVLAEGGRKSLILEDAKLREGPSTLSPAQTLNFMSLPGMTITSQEFIPKGYTVHLVARTVTTEQIQDWNDYWYYIAIYVDYEEGGSYYLGWVYGALLQK